MPHYLLIKVTLIDQLLHKERHWLWQILVFLKVDVKNKIFFFIFVVWFQAECSMWRLIITDKIFLCKNLDLVETGSWGFKWTSKNKQHRETQMTAMDKPSWVTIMLIKESFPDEGKLSNPFFSSRSFWNIKLFFFLCKNFLDSKITFMEEVFISRLCVFNLDGFNFHYRLRLEK